ncbi:hypothetical protein MRX96_031980 [Rhipicephalus microplus]
MYVYTFKDYKEAGTRSQKKKAGQRGAADEEETQVDPLAGGFFGGGKFKGARSSNVHQRDGASVAPFTLAPSRAVACPTHSADAPPISRTPRTCPEQPCSNATAALDSKAFPGTAYTPMQNVERSEVRDRGSVVSCVSRLLLVVERCLPRSIAYVFVHPRSTETVQTCSRRSGTTWIECRGTKYLSPDVIYCRCRLVELCSSRSVRLHLIRNYGVMPESA